MVCISASDKSEFFLQKSSFAFCKLAGLSGWAIAMVVNEDAV
jgi:hypothetical protein